MSATNYETQGVVVWKYGVNGVSDLIRIEGKMTTVKYKQILIQHAMASDLRLIGRYFVFQKENDPKHTENIVKTYLQQKQGRGDVQLLDWPPHSADLNIIECLWNYLGKEKNDAETDQKEKKELVRSLTEEKLPTEGCTGRNGEWEKSSDIIKISGSYAETKRKAENRKDWRMELAGVYNKEITVSLPQRNAVIRIVSDQQKLNRPPLPQSIRETDIVEPYNKTLRGQNFMFFDSGDNEGRVLMFATDRNLVLLAASDTIFSDGFLHYNTVMMAVKWHPYKVHLLQELSEDELHRRTQFSETLSDMLNQEPNLVKTNHILR
ncbi:hypothetical protein ANN_27295 [Periplaneta americana]|uniref:Uncharacterized protein n=1 Tax=Periplaneta americana TaxID=6978 RepID=A0ABQ8RXS3_PERAM|nr:hypothetical protein ANN_27295 [Periplaneta americana]